MVFDEAQRAWDARQLASFMKRKKGIPGFTQSESELLLSALDPSARSNRFRTKVTFPAATDCRTFESSMSALFRRHT